MPGECRTDLGIIRAANRWMDKLVKSGQVWADENWEWWGRRKDGRVVWFGRKSGRQAVSLALYLFHRPDRNDW